MLSCSCAVHFPFILILATAFGASASFLHDIDLVQVRRADSGFLCRCGETNRKSGDGNKKQAQTNGAASWRHRKQSWEEFHIQRRRTEKEEEAHTEPRTTQTFSYHAAKHEVPMPQAINAIHLCHCILSKAFQWNVKLALCHQSQHVSCWSPIYCCQQNKKIYTATFLCSTFIVSPKTAFPSQSCSAISLHHAVIIVILFHAGNWKRLACRSGGNWQVGFAKQPQGGGAQQHNALMPPSDQTLECYRSHPMCPIFHLKLLVFELHCGKYLHFPLCKNMAA